MVFVPFNSNTIGLFDPSINASPLRKPAYTLSQTPAPSRSVALLPYNSAY
eukprot:COSAG01_NODE_6632_length_3567_cov_1.835206_5_plen_50_part_00